MVTKTMRRNSNDVNQKRLCFACGSQHHLMRNCELLRKLREESSLSYETTRGSAPSAKSAKVDSKGHICFAAIQASAEETWFLDSGASEHMTGKADNLDRCEKVKQQGVILADGKVLFSKCIGEKEMEVMRNADTDEAVSIRMERVLVVEGLSMNLMSVQAITRKGFEVLFNTNECRILRNGQTIVTGVKEGQLYRLINKNVKQ